MEYGYDENNKYNRYDIYSESAKKNKFKITNNSWEMEQKQNVNLNYKQLK